MNPITLEDFAAIPEFIHNGAVCVEIDGKIYSKRGVYNFLVMAGLLILN